jgi:hypothetical protein
MICIDCLKICEAIGCMGKPLCCNCRNFVLQKELDKCQFCKDWFKEFEVVQEIDSEKIWLLMR